MRLKMLSIVLFILAYPFWCSAQKQTAPVKPDPAADEKARYVGLKYRELQLPAGLAKGYENSIFGDAQDHIFQTMTRGKVKMLWLGRIIGREFDSSGKTRNYEVEVKDIAILPPMTSRQILAFNRCYVGKRSDTATANIGVIVQPFVRQTTEYYRPLKAWQANLDTGKLVEISVKTVRCPPQDVD